MIQQKFLGSFRTKIYRIFFQSDYKTASVYFGKLALYNSKSDHAFSFVFFVTFYAKIQLVFGLKANYA